MPQREFLDSCSQPFDNESGSCSQPWRISLKMSVVGWGNSSIREAFALPKLEDLDLIPRICGEKKVGGVSCTYNPSAGEVETGGSLGLTHLASSRPERDPGLKG